jgi:glycosyltransferase involved in cell wall biosynthesis
MSAQRPRLALIHPWLLPSGGSEPVALWTAEELKSDFDVEILTMGESSLDELNTAYGTSLAEPEVRFVRLPIPRLFKMHGDAWRSIRLIRRVRARAREFDVLLSSYNVMDFGRPGIQYISDFSFFDPLRRALMEDARNWRKGFRRAGAVRRGYLALARVLSGQMKGGWKRNVTVANSAWSRGLLADVFGVKASVVFPPVPRIDSPLPWERRAEGFVSIGRIVPEKRVIEMIDILARVRSAAPELVYHVAGRVPDSPYGRAVVDKARTAGRWVALEGPVFGPAKTERLAGYRYGLAGCLHESFGIAAAEMVRAGMIVWVPASGGQTEIVDHPDLTYDDDADAAVKIGRVLRDPARQAALRAHLARQAEKFSVERFRAGIREAVTRFRETYESRTS